MNEKSTKFQHLDTNESRTPLSDKFSHILDETVDKVDTDCCSIKNTTADTSLEKRKLSVENSQSFSEPRVNKFKMENYLLKQKPGSDDESMVVSSVKNNKDTFSSPHVNESPIDIRDEIILSKFRAKLETALKRVNFLEFEAEIQSKYDRKCEEYQLLSQNYQDLSCSLSEKNESIQTMRILLEEQKSHSMSIEDSCKSRLCEFQDTLLNAQTENKVLKEQLEVLKKDNQFLRDKLQEIDLVSVATEKVVEKLQERIHGIENLILESKNYLDEMKVVQDLLNEKQDELKATNVRNLKNLDEAKKKIEGLIQELSRKSKDLETIALESASRNEQMVLVDKRFESLVLDLDRRSRESTNLIVAFAESQIILNRLLKQRLPTTCNHNTTEGESELQ